MWTASKTRFDFRLLLLRLLYIQMFFSDSVYTTEGSIIYASRSGYDTPACGTKSRPCKTLATAVNQAKHWGDLIYIDGTGTSRDPYTCKNVTPQHPGIYVNRSISLVGQQLPVYIECGKGLSLRFEADNQSKTLMTIKLRSILFVGSSLTFKDCFVQIDGCLFIGGLQPISVTQETHSVNLSIVNSGCVNSSACFSVEQKVQSPSGKHVTIEIYNTRVMGMRARYEPTPHATGAALCVTSAISHYAPELSITTDIHLDNVTFTDNQFSGNGLLYFSIPVGQATMAFDNVTFSKTSAIRNISSSSAIFIHGVNQLDLKVEDSRFADNLYGIRGIAAATSGDTNVQIRNSQFIDHRSPGEGAVLYLTTPTASRLEVTSSKFIRNKANGIGGCFYITAQTSTASIQDCIFTGSQAGQHSGVSYFYATELVKVAVNNSLLVENFAKGAAGVMSCNGETVNVTILNTKVFNSNAIGPGGVFVISYSRKTPRSLYMLLDSVHIENSTSRAYGGAIALSSGKNTKVTIRNSIFKKNSANAVGGAISVFTSGLASLVMHLSNTSFRESIAVGSGGTIHAEGVSGFKCNNVHVSSSTSLGDGDGGAFYLFSRLPKVVIHINDSSFRNCNSTSAGGALLISGLTDEVLIINSVFQSNVATNPGGAMHISRADKVSVLNSSFIGCIAKQGGAGAVRIRGGNPKNITFKSCTFYNNYSPLGPGGAIYVSGSEDKLVDPGCLLQISPTVKYRKWLYGTVTQIMDTEFCGNLALTGGAVFLAKGQHFFHSCIFRNNFAAIRGGHLATDEVSTCAKISNTKFLQNESSKIYRGVSFEVMSFIATESAGPLLLYDTLLEQSAVRGLHTIVSVSNGGQVNFSNTPLFCPPGSSLEFFNFTNRITTQSCTISITVLQLNCKSCVPGYYSLQRGQSRGLSVVGGFQCLPCPFGADCSENIRAEENFWGYRVRENPPALNFSVCPVNYCKQPGQQSAEYNACKGNRAGTLCGKCKAGYTETLVSPVCRPVIDCDDTWFWGVAVLFALLMALYLIVKPPLLGFLMRHILWFRSARDETDVMQEHDEQPHATQEHDEQPDATQERDDPPDVTQGRDEQPCVTQESDEQPGVTQERDNKQLGVKQDRDDQPGVTQERDEQPGVTQERDSGFLKILFYFYQVANLLLVSTSSGALTKNFVLQPVLGLFNFQLRPSANGLLCPFPGLTAVTKELLLATQVFAVLAAVALWYFSHRALRKIKKRPPPSTGPYLGALVETLLLGYATLSTVALKLVRCVSIGTESRLFMASEVTCYQWWQYLLMGFLCVNVVPFVLFLAGASCWLHKGTISAQQLLIGCILPLPFLIYRLVGSRCCYNLAPEGLPEWKASVARVLYDPFISPDPSTTRVYWESVLIGRRLVLIVLYVTISDLLTRQLTLILVCVVILLHHSLVSPFRDSKANYTETASLFCLVTIATLNILQASFLSLGQVPRGTLRSLIEACDWIQVSLLSVVPVLFVAVIVMSIISQVIRLVCSIYAIYRHNNDHEVQMPLHITDTNDDVIVANDNEAWRNRSTRVKRN